MENPIKIDFFEENPPFSETRMYLCNLKFQIPRFVLLDFGSGWHLHLTPWSWSTAGAKIMALPTTSTRNKG